MDEQEEVVRALMESLGAVIDTYVTGHDLPVSMVVGILHMLAFEIMHDSYLDESDDDEDTDE